MGRATRWFKGLFGIKNKEKENKLCHNNPISTDLTPVEAAWLRSFYSESDKERNKHAIAVAAATAAAADAAVAAAQAAAAVVRLTVQGRGSREKLAAVKIQTFFRGYLARRALGALKGLVKIQALVRGFLVRKQAAATLRGMQTLIRVQASVRARAKKNRRLIHKDNTFPPQFQARKSSQEQFDDARKEHSINVLLSRRGLEAANNAFDESPKIVEVDTGCRPKSRSRTRNRRTNSWMSNPATDESFSSPFPYQIPVQDCYFSTAQSTPRLVISNSCLCNSPAKSVCAESYFGIYGEKPNYMAKTKSFRAKLRSQSAPKYRPEPGPDKGMLIHEMMDQRNSLSGVRMQRSGSHAEEAIIFKNAAMGKLGSSFDFVRES